MNNIISLFHHIHHNDESHEVHHCGGKHVEIDNKLDYTIDHCSCGLHCIDKNIAIGHTTDESLKSIEVKIKFINKCPDGGWHIESGKKL